MLELRLPQRKGHVRGFLGGPVVKNPPSNAGDVDSIPGRGTKIPRATGHMSPRATTTELMRLNVRARVLQTVESTCSGARATTREEKTRTPQQALQ